MLGDFVTAEDGTGIVHTAPGFGEDDNWVSLSAKRHEKPPCRRFTPHSPAFRRFRI